MAFFKDRCSGAWAHILAQVYTCWAPIVEGGWRGPPGAGGPSLIWGPGQFSGVWEQVLSGGPVPACDVTPGLLGGEVQKWGLL